MTEQEVDDIVERAVSKKRTVKDVLIEMRDTSELMVDLAYSALLTNSREIAEEVQTLERRMDDLQYEIEGLLLLSARTIEDAANLAGISHVALSAENIANSADDIVDVVLRGIGDHPIYKSFLGESKERVIRTQLKADSALISKTLGELNISTETGAYIRAIRRGPSWIYSPEKGTRILEGDILIAKGSELAVENLRKLCGSEDEG
ncbi:MAG: hypothetical protein KAU03_01790 [Candidatus Altiarchaeales archaeon]|nr:hypothetical protein [Candidatus Altiarchaeales archaeon]